MVHKVKRRLAAARSRYKPAYGRGRQPAQSQCNKEKPSFWWQLLQQANPKKIWIFSFKRLIIAKRRQRRASFPEDILEEKDVPPKKRF
jgi:hypothetical protein